MSLSLFIAHRIYRGSDLGKQVSRPAVLIATIGVAIGLAVMIIAVSVIIGFKSQVRDKIIGFGSHIQISHADAARSFETRPVAATDSLLAVLHDYPAVKHVQRYSTKPGMIKTSDAFQGMVLKGIGPEYSTSFFRRHLLEGEFPQFSDSASSNRVVISKAIADKMKLKLGDKIDTYYIQKEVRARRLTIVGIYQTNFSEYDNLFLLTDLCLVNRLNKWEPDQVSGIELELRDYSQLDAATYQIADELSKHPDHYGAEYCVRNVEQLNPSIFAWLEILDVNIWVILILMLGVAGFTMVSGLLIIIIERTSMIGILKSLGANNYTIRKLFLWLAVFLIGKGMLWGNLIGLAFYFVQKWFGLFRLNPETYYMDTVPVSFNIWIFLLLNVGTLLASVFMLLGPSYIITRIRPANSMRYE
ncbi:MAG: ABC transporter permease [Bacteroides sp.]|nr:ABC transporter permease [Bacteroides sp.]